MKKLITDITNNTLLNVLIIIIVLSQVSIYIITGKICETPSSSAILMYMMDVYLLFSCSRVLWNKYKSKEDQV